MGAFITHPGLACKRLGAGLVVPVILLGCTSAPKTYKRSQLLMGTTVEITAVATNEATADAAMTAAFGEIRRIENLLSTYKDTSELSRVNQGAGKAPVQVSSEVLSLVEEAFRISDLTEGGFNIALGPAIKLWGIAEKAPIPTDEQLEAIRPLVQYTDVRLDPADRTIDLPKKGMRLDVGGIGKGYAADRAAAVMQTRGVHNGIIAVAGDIKTFGLKPNGRPWRIAVRHPRREDKPLGEITLGDEAVSTSGDYERFYIRNGRRYHHILEPATLRPADLSQSVTIVAREAILTDALATGIFVMGSAKGMRLIERLPEVEGVIVDAKGKVFVSSGLKSRFKRDDS
jgi:thiamine biosynthesis lipoprotein